MIKSLSKVFLTAFFSLRVLSHPEFFRLERAACFISISHNSTADCSLTVALMYTQFLEIYSKIAFNSFDTLRTTVYVLSSKVP